MLILASFSPWNCSSYPFSAPQLSTVHCLVCGSQAEHKEPCLMIWGICPMILLLMFSIITSNKEVGSGFYIHSPTYGKSFLFLLKWFFLKKIVLCSLVFCLLVCPREGVSSLKLELQQLWATMWLLRIKPASSRRAASTVNCWATSLALWSDFQFHSLTFFFSFPFWWPNAKNGEFLTCWV